MSIQVGSKRLVWMEVTKVYNDGEVQMQLADLPEYERSGLTEIYIPETTLEQIKQDS